MNKKQVKQGLLWNYFESKKRKETDSPMRPVKRNYEDSVQELIAEAKRVLEAKETKSQEKNAGSSFNLRVFYFLNKIR